MAVASDSVGEQLLVPCLPAPLRRKHPGRKYPDDQRDSADDQYGWADEKSGRAEILKAPVGAAQANARGQMPCITSRLFALWLQSPHLFASHSRCW